MTGKVLAPIAYQAQGSQAKEVPVVTKVGQGGWRLVDFCNYPSELSSGPFKERKKEGPRNSKTGEEELQ